VEIGAQSNIKRMPRKCRPPPRSGPERRQKGQPPQRKTTWHSRLHAKDESAGIVQHRGNCFGRLHWA